MTNNNTQELYYILDNNKIKILNEIELIKFVDSEHNKQIIIEGEEGEFFIQENNPTLWNYKDVWEISSNDKEYMERELHEAQLQQAIDDAEQLGKFSLFYSAEELVEYLADFEIKLD